MAVKNPTERWLPARSGGFTLIELLVVISIIALLIALALPALSGSSERARRSKCATNLRSLAVAVNTYVNEYADSYPIAEDPFNQATRLVPAVVAQPFDALRGQLQWEGNWGDFSSARCPSDQIVQPRVGASYFYFPSVIYGFLSEYPASAADRRINQVQQMLRLGLVADLWLEIDRSAHSGSKRAQTMTFQIGSMDGSVRVQSITGIGGFEVEEWLP